MAISATTTTPDVTATPPETTAETITTTDETTTTVAFCAALAVEGYLLLGEARRQTAHARQTLAAANALLGLVPSKSAPRTDGADEQPRRWWQRLTLSALTVEVGDDTDVIDVVPSTDIQPALDLAGGLRTRPSPRPRADVDLSRFSFDPSGRKAMSQADPR